MGLGHTEIILIILVIVILFGAKRIPELARSLGKAKHEYKKAQEEFIAGLDGEEEPKKEAPAAKIETKENESGKQA